MGYTAARSIEEAFVALTSPGVSVIAGGTDWFTQPAERLAGKALLDVNGIPGFRGISRTATGWRIGAATRWSDFVGADLPAAFDGLKAAAQEVGSVQIQNLGTIGGNLCNASPAADGVPPLLTLNAGVELVSAQGSRTLPLGDFITGARRTALATGELVAGVHVPDAGQGVRGGFVKLGSRRFMVISIAMVAVVLRCEAGRIADLRVSVGACSAVACRLPLLEQALTGHRLSAGLAAIEPAWMLGLAPITDLRGTAEYRVHAVARLIERLLARMMADVGQDG